MQQKTKIVGKVTDAFLCKPLAKVKITLIDKDNNVLLVQYSSPKGIWSLNHTEEVHSVVFELQGFVTKEVHIKNDFPQVVRLLENKLIGYQNKLWFNPGEKVSAYIHSPEGFEARLIRHGIENEEIIKIGSFPTIIQDVPNGFFVGEGVNWKEAFSYKIPTDIDSGLYSLRLIDNGANEYSITYVIQPNSNQNGQNKKILVLASTNNWQTYNIWGGRSRYRNFENPKTSQIINNLKTFGLRFVPENIKSFSKKILKKQTVVTIKDHPNAFQFRPLSLQRPHPNCSINDERVTNKFTSHLAPGEWRILSWLEREGFEYDLTSGYELHNNPKLLNNYNVILLSTHCEYWSKEMFIGLKIFYNNVEDESQLIGVRFDMRGYGSCAPYKIIEEGHWVFKGTNLRKGDLFAKKSLNNYSHINNIDFNADPASSPGMAPLTGDGGSGWETDKITSDAPSDIKLIAKGTNKKGGGADMVLRESEEKGIMFSASSITFGGTLLIDDACSKIVKNVITKAVEKNNKD
jgi:hypothetical protein